MNILTGDDIRKADIATMSEEPVSGIDLMERASASLAHAVFEKIKEFSHSCVGNGIGGANGCARGVDVVFFCGKGNNGGDGYAVARLLSSFILADNDELRSTVVRIAVVRLFPPEQMSSECRTNFDRLPPSVSVTCFPEFCRLLGLDAGGNLSGEVCLADSNSTDYIWKTFGKDSLLIVDALLGTGVKGTVKDPVASAIRAVNCLRGRRRSGKTHVISIDMPSGLPTEPPEGEYIAGRMNNGEPDGRYVVADETLTIEFPKLSLLYPSSGQFAGKVGVVPIGLSESFIENNPSGYEWIDGRLISQIRPTRNAFAHKGCFGHALVVAGSQGMMGAAVLATAAALRSGCGIVTAHVPFEERHVIHISQPSAIVSTYNGPCLSGLPGDLSRYNAIGIGPGLGKADETSRILRDLLKSGIPAVLDADALNIISSNPVLFGLIPANSLLTPHIGELRRLLRAASEIGMVGKRNTSPLPCSGRKEADSTDPWGSEAEKTHMVMELASSIDSVIVVKGAHTMICPPNGSVKFNMTGNPGMAKGGSGDVLTGLLTGLMARGLTAEQAAILGVYIHGAAGDAAASEIGEEAMNASDIVGHISDRVVEM